MEKFLRMIWRDVKIAICSFRLYFQRRNTIGSNNSSTSLNAPDGRGELQIRRNTDQISVIREESPPPTSILPERRRLPKPTPSPTEKKKNTSWLSRLKPSKKWTRHRFLLICLIGSARCMSMWVPIPPSSSYALDFFSMCTLYLSSRHSLNSFIIAMPGMRACHLYNPVLSKRFLPTRFPLIPPQNTRRVGAHDASLRFCLKKVLSSKYTSNNKVMFCWHC